MSMEGDSREGEVIVVGVGEYDKGWPAAKWLLQGSLGVPIHTIVFVHVFKPGVPLPPAWNGGSSPAPTTETEVKVLQMKKHLEDFKRSAIETFQIPNAKTVFLRGRVGQGLCAVVAKENASRVVLGAPSESSWLHVGSWVGDRTVQYCEEHLPASIPVTVIRNGRKKIDPTTPRRNQPRQPALDEVDIIATGPRGVPNWVPHPQQPALNTPLLQPANSVPLSPQSSVASLGSAGSEFAERRAESAQPAPAPTPSSHGMVIITHSTPRYPVKQSSSYPGSVVDAKPITPMLATQEASSASNAQTMAATGSMLSAQPVGSVPMSEAMARAKAAMTVSPTSSTLVAEEPWVARTTSGAHQDSAAQSTLVAPDVRLNSSAAQQPPIAPPAGSGAPTSGAQMSTTATLTVSAPTVSDAFSADPQEGSQSDSRRKGRKVDPRQDAKGEADNDIEELLLNRYGMEEMYEATVNFADHNRIESGRGGSKMWRGRLDDMPVTINEVPSGWEHFSQEIDVMKRISHKNVVTLLGYCSECETNHGIQRGPFQVLEFASKGSLGSFLDPKLDFPLTWMQRKVILVGMARGLRYLHEFVRGGQILHRNINRQNILLDEKWEPLVANFSAAQFYDDKEKRRYTCVVAEGGYMPPEALRGVVTERSDVYSFGVVALEVLTGLPPIETNLGPLIELALAQQSNPLRLADKRMEGEYDLKEFEFIFWVALQCTQQDHDARPLMKQVVYLLEKHLRMPERPGTGTTELRPIPEVSGSFSQYET